MAVARAAAPDNPSTALCTLAKLPAEVQACIEKLAECKQSGDELGQSKQQACQG